MKNLLRNLFATISILMLFVFIISLNVNEVVGSTSGTKLCPPGYTIDENGYCNSDTISNIPDTKMNEISNLDISNSSSIKLQEKSLPQSLPATHRTDCVINDQPSDTSSFVSPSSADYTAVLSPADVVPPVYSTSSGQAYFSFDVGHTTLSYSIYADFLSQVYSVHIHAGSEGTNGPIIFTLLNVTAPYNLNDTYDIINETIGAGNIGAECLEGPLRGKTIKDLNDLMMAGDTYVEVHTLTLSLAELRGTILPNTSGSSQVESDMGDEDNDECYDSGYSDGQNGSFSQSTYDYCKEGDGGDGGDEYYNGFINGCMSVEGNTRNVCDLASDG